MSGPRTHDKNDLVVITGAGGFIGGHLVSELVRQGHSRVRAVDIKPFDDWYQLVRGRVARYHNVYGPLGAFEGGRESAGGLVPKGHRSAALGQQGHRSMGRR